MLAEILAHHSGRSVENVKKETERDRYLSAEEAKEWGLIDEVLNRESGEGEKADE